MSLYRGTGGATSVSGDASVEQVLQYSTEAQAAAAAASNSESAAAASAAAAANSESGVAADAATASAAASAASSSETAAANSASAASTSETNAAASESAAATSETNAAASESAAATSESNASSSAAAASLNATSASDSASSAFTSASNAATSESNAATSETNASNSASAASTSASNASTSETNAASSASSASTSATNASNAQSYSEEWANKAEDSLVSVAAGGDGSTEYSAKHWAAKAATTVANNANSINDNLPTILPTLNLDFANAKTLDPRITYTRSSTATYYDEKGRLVTAASGEPRFDHDPDTLECRGLLIEEQRTNLLKYSEQFDGTGWTSTTGATVYANSTTAPDGTTTADTVVEDSSTGLHQRGIPVTFNTSTNYACSVYVKAASGTRRLGIVLTVSSGGAANVTYNLDTQAIGTSTGGTYPFTILSTNITDVGDGWYRCEMTATSGATAGAGFVVYRLDNGSTVSYTGDGTSGIYIWGAQLEEGAFPTSYIPSTETFTSRASTATYYDSTGTLQTAAVNEERLSYNPADLTAPPKQLFEEQRTNLLTYSEEFDNAAWIKVNSSISANATVAPDGTNTADKLVEDASNLWFNVRTASFAITAQAYVFSVYAKAGERSVIQVVPNGTYFPSSYVNFDLSAGTVSVSNGVDYSSITEVGNGWYRCIVVDTATSAGTSGPFYFATQNSPTAGRVASYIGDGTSGIYIWGAQVEAGAYPTSYIPTTSSTVTRSADVYSSATSTRSADSASMTGDNFSEWYRQDEGTLYVDVDSFDSANAYVLTVGTASSGPRIQITYNGEHKLNTAVVDNSGTIVVANLGGPEGATSYIAAGYAENDVAISLDGSSVYTDTSCTLPTVETLFIGSDQSSGVPLNGTIRKLAYYPKRLTNAQLQAVTEE